MKCYPLAEDDARLANLDDEGRRLVEKNLVRTTRTHRCYNEGPPPRRLSRRPPETVPEDYDPTDKSNFLSCCDAATLLARNAKR